MLKFINIGHGSYFCGYTPDKFNIELDKEYTVREFINEILKSHSTEWG